MNTPSEWHIERERVKRLARLSAEDLIKTMSPEQIHELALKYLTRLEAHKIQYPRGA